MTARLNRVYFLGLTKTGRPERVGATLWAEGRLVELLNVREADHAGLGPCLYPPLHDVSPGKLAIDAVCFRLRIQSGRIGALRAQKAAVNKQTLNA